MAMYTLLCHFFNWHTECRDGFDVAVVGEKVDFTGSWADLGEAYDGPSKEESY